MRACCLIRTQPAYRHDAFAAGLSACGFHVVSDPGHAEVLVIWNRYSRFDALARDFERRGKPVIVAENSYLGREWRGGYWYTLALSHHNGCGRYPPPGAGDRWDGWGVPLAPWREAGGECVVLAQRGIGEPGVAQPPGWPEAAANAIRRQGLACRIRQHPGEHVPQVTLEDDLRRAGAAFTWGSGAALKALLNGINVFHGLPRWIGGAAARQWEPGRALPPPNLDGRLAMFRALAWTIWEVQEIATGAPFARLLEHFDKSLEAA